MIFSDYRSSLPSGEREVVQNEVNALRRAGIEVHLISSTTDEGLQERLYSLRAAGRVATGFGGSPLERVLDVEPDLVHVHNIFPNFGARWLSYLNAPLVVTLHNYRLLCAEGSLFRNGLPCTLCPDGSRLSALRHRCYRGSASATLPLVIANRRGLPKHPLIERSDLVLVPSEFQREILIKYGLDRSRSRTSPSFAPDTLRGVPLSGEERRAGWVFVGRLDAGKGILQLLEVWPSHEQLTVIGDGPLMDSVKCAANPSVRVVGRQTRASVDDVLRSSEGLIFPSTHFETQGLAYLEALRAGTPVVARRGNAVAAAVVSDSTGVVYTDSWELRQALDAVREDAEGLTARCRGAFLERYSEGVWLARRHAEYGELLAQFRQDLTKSSDPHAEAAE